MLDELDEPDDHDDAAAQKLKGKAKRNTGKGRGEKAGGCMTAAASLGSWVLRTAEK